MIRYAGPGTSIGLEFRKIALFHFENYYVKLLCLLSNIKCTQFLKPKRLVDYICNLKLHTTKIY